jgi:hypothetical protein
MTLVNFTYVLFSRKNDGEETGIFILIGNPWNHLEHLLIHLWFPCSYQKITLRWKDEN